MCVATQDLHRGQLGCSYRHGRIAEEVLQSRVGGPFRPNAGLQVRRPMQPLLSSVLAFVKKEWEAREGEAQAFIAPRKRKTLL